MTSIVLDLNDREPAKEQVARLKEAGFRRQVVWVKEGGTSKSAEENQLVKLRPGRFCVTSTWGMGPD